MNRTEKTEQVAELRDVFDGSQLMVVTHYTGLDVASMVALRRALREANGGYRVVKNTLAKRALEGTGGEPIGPLLTGPVGVAYSKEDAAAVAKVVTEFVKTHPKLEIKGAMLSGGAILTAAEVDALGKLPGKDQMRAKLLSAMIGVPRNFLGVLTGAQRNFFNLVSARQKQLEDGGQQ